MNTVLSLRRLAVCAAVISLFPATTLLADDFTTLLKISGPGMSPGPIGDIRLAGSTLYGVTPGSGANNDGAVFSYNLNTGVESILHSFSGSDGATPVGVTLVGSTLYGSTEYGGGGPVAGGLGTLFSIDTSGSGFTSLLSFADQGAFPFNDGTQPSATLAPVGSLLYGIASGFGPDGGVVFGGTLFSYNPGNGEITNLHSFGSSGDGSQPYSDLTVAGSILYGTTYAGGASGVGSNGSGAIFSYNIATGQETVLYSFLGGTAGNRPLGGLTLVGSTLYGTTSGGASVFEPGTLFSYNLITGQETVLHTFSAGNDGTDPASNLTLVGSTLYGTTRLGGTIGGGTIFTYNITSGAYADVHDFGGTGGGNPNSLTLSGTTLYGTTEDGDGTIFAFQTPEPSTYVLALLGLGSLCAVGSRRRFEKRC